MGERKEIMRERKERVNQGTCIKDPWTKTIGGRIECRREGGQSRGEQSEKMGTTVIEQQ